jgi:hypothetical protein
VTDGPTDYPDSWRPRGALSSAPAPPEAIAMAVDAYVASLSDAEFQALVERTRGRTLL